MSIYNINPFQRHLGVCTITQFIKWFSRLMCLFLFFSKSCPVIYFPSEDATSVSSLSKTFSLIKRSLGDILILVFFSFLLYINLGGFLFFALKFKPAFYNNCILLKQIGESVNDSTLELSRQYLLLSSLGSFRSASLSRMLAAYVLCSELYPRLCCPLSRLPE